MRRGDPETFSGVKLCHTQISHERFAKIYYILLQLKIRNVHRLKSKCTQHTLV